MNVLEIMLIQYQVKHVVIHVYIIYKNQRNNVQKVVQVIINMKYKKIESIVYLIVQNNSHMNLSNSMNVQNNVMENMLVQLIGVMTKYVIINVNFIPLLVMEQNK